MMEHKDILAGLEPSAVFSFFEEMSRIPRGSGHTKDIADWCVGFARTRRLEHYRDASDNVIIIREATPGREEEEPVIIQGHLDMVCVKDPDCPIDMEREGLRLKVEGDWVSAEGTTLGADDGIAVAIGLALLDGAVPSHPRLECLFTSDEEIGMFGAAALDPSPLRGRRMLNLDSEREGVFTAGCAGGATAICRLPVERTDVNGAETYRLSVSGLAGGHSGEAIHLGRANACILLGRAVDELRGQLSLRLSAMEGGEKHNAIPTSAEAVLVLENAADAEKAPGIIKTFEDQLRREYRLTEPDLALTMEKISAEEPVAALTATDTDRCVDYLLCAPNGILEMSHDFPGKVQTSLNLGILTLTGKTFSAEFCVRSGFATQRQYLCRNLEALTARMGGAMETEGVYPAWEYRPVSPLRERLTELYRAQMGAEPEVTVIHGGLECGILAEKLPGLDCVSIGPDVPDIHTPRERMRISTVQHLWELVAEFLAKP